MADAVAAGRLTASRDAPVGGQAVLEGVMMRGVHNWAVAVRRPDSTVQIDAFALPARAGRRRIRRLPLLRGVFALVESLRIGLRALSIAAGAQLSEEDAGSEAPPAGLSGGVWAGTIVIAIVFAVGLFFVVPVSITSVFRGALGSSWAFWLVEGLIRSAIFLGYLALLARMPDLRRVFEYHGAEHKVISCFEAGDTLTPERAALYSRFHPRCGTSFLLIVMVVAIFVFAPLGLPAWWVLVLTRIAGVPVIVGLSFELIRWAGRNRARRWVRAIIWPGMQLQKLTTREPDLDQLAVAIASLEAVLARETPGSLDAEDLLGVEVVA